MINEFLNCLVGRWTNQNQAYSNPSKYAWILVSWEPVGNDKYLSKQWYHYEGETKPYAQRYNIFTETESGILVQNWSLDGIRNDKCDQIVTFVDDKWKGKNIGDECIIRNAVLHSEFELSQNQLLTRDAGYADDKLVWGSKDYYQFGRLAQR